MLFEVCDSIIYIYCALFLCLHVKATAALQYTLLVSVHAQSSKKEFLLQVTEHCVRRFAVDISMLLFWAL